MYMNLIIQMFVQEFVLLNRFAIYIPLFLPIGLPILGSLFKAIKWIKSKRKQKPKTDWFNIFLRYIHAWFFHSILLFSMTYTYITFVNLLKFMHTFDSHYMPFIHTDIEQKNHHLVNTCIIKQLYQFSWVTCIIETDK